MLIRDIMQTKVQLVELKTPIKEVAQMMREGDFGIVPVQENEKMVGMITDRDIVLRCVAEDKSPSECMARDVMTDEVLYCYDDQNIEDLSRTLSENKVRRMPVVNRDKRLVGIVSLSDLAAPEQSKNLAGNTLHEVSH